MEALRAIYEDDLKALEEEEEVGRLHCVTIRTEGDWERRIIAQFEVRSVTGRRWLPQLP